MKTIVFRKKNDDFQEIGVFRFFCKFKYYFGVDFAPTGASWSYFGALGGLLGALKRHLQGVGRVSGVPWRFSALLSDPGEYFIAVFGTNFWDKACVACVASVF